MYMVSGIKTPSFYKLYLVYVWKAKHKICIEQKITLEQLWSTLIYLKQKLREMQIYINIFVIISISWSTLAAFTN